MVCLGLEPRAAGWKAQTNPLSYSGTPTSQLLTIEGILVFFLEPGTGLNGARVELGQACG